MVSEIKKDFPILSQEVNGKTVCYLDSGASAQKPKVVMDAVNKITKEYYANVHRGVHTFGSKTTTAYEGAREKVKLFINADNSNEIVFTKNATEAINLVAASFGERLQKDDEVIITELEHHANIVPWYFLKEKKGIKLKIVPIKADGSLDILEFDKLLSSKTKLVAVTQMSNVLGTITPIKEMITKAHSFGAKVLIDGSQGAVHLGADMKELDCDFYVFTAHKLFALTGIGILYGKEDLLNSMPPYQGGGEMVEEVSFEKITYKDAPNRFEAGTPPIIEAVSLGAAIDYLSGLNMQELKDNEKKLFDEAKKRLSEIEGVKIFSQASESSAIISFNIEGVHHHDAATIFDQMGVAVRVGHHCAQPLMKKLGVTGTIRASFSIYNDMDDVKRLIEAVNKVKVMLS